MLFLLKITSPRNYGSTLPAALYSALFPGFGPTIVNSPINSFLTGLSRPPGSCEAPGGGGAAEHRDRLRFCLEVLALWSMSIITERVWGGERLPFLILKMETARFGEVGRPARSHIAGKQRNSLSYQAESPHSAPLPPCWQWESSCLMPLREVLLFFHLGEDCCCAFVPGLALELRVHVISRTEVWRSGGIRSAEKGR